MGNRFGRKKTLARKKKRDFRDQMHGFAGDGLAVAGDEAERGGQGLGAGQENPKTDLYV